jgi:hypothetical protein
MKFMTEFDVNVRAANYETSIQRVSEEGGVFKLAVSLKNSP